jgi:hypothetical protein
MVDQDGLPQGTSKPSNSQPKRRWEPPTIEEIDYDATASDQVGDTLDFTAYSA